MENSPRKSLSLNLDISELFFGSSYRPTSNLIANQKMFTAQGFKSPSQRQTPNELHRMSHSLSMDDTRSDAAIPKKNIVQSMIGVFGSLTNMVSKIPNFMASINPSLSVTVVPNEGIISSEYIVKNLTRSSEHLASTNDNSIKMFGSMPNKMQYAKSHIVDIFATQLVANSVSHQKLMDANNVLPKTWMEDFHDSEDCFNDTNSTSQASDLKLAIEESIRHMENRKLGDEMKIVEPEKKTNPRLEDQKSMQMQSTALEKTSTTNSLLKVIPKQSTEKKLRVGDDLLDKIDSETVFKARPDNFPDMETMKKNLSLPKMWRKLNVIARSRGKGRGRLQLRRSGVSQSKHRKERIKQDLYSNIQDDMDAWNDEQQDSSEEQLGTSASSATDDDFQPVDLVTFCTTVPEYSVHVESFTFGDLATQDIRKKPRTLSESPKQSPKEYTTVMCDFRSRVVSESSVDSEDSCFIVFEDGSESECTDYDYESSSSDEFEEDGNSDQKVRFDIHPKVHTMVQWDFAYRAARKGPWEEMARDRERFRGRIHCISRVLDPILSANHRACIYQKRFAEQD